MHRYVSIKPECRCYRQYKSQCGTALADVDMHYFVHFSQNSLAVPWRNVKYAFGSIVAYSRTHLSEAVRRCFYVARKLPAYYVRRFICKCGAYKHTMCHGLGRRRLNCSMQLSWTYDCSHKPISRNERIFSSGIFTISQAPMCIGTTKDMVLPLRFLSDCMSLYSSSIP